MANKLQAAKAFEPETLALLDATTSTQTVVNQKIINTLIRRLKLAGAWRMYDFFYFPAMADSQIATLNWKAPLSFALTHVGGPTFTAYRGFSYNGTTQYSDTGFIPSTHATQIKAGSPINAMVGTHLFADTTGNGRSIGGRNTDPQGTALIPRNANAVQFTLNNTATSAAGTMSDGTGFTIIQRETDDTVSTYKNGVVFANTATAQTGSTLSTRSIYLGAMNANATASNFRACTVSVALGGSRMNPMRHYEAYKAILATLQAVGAA